MVHATPMVKRRARVCAQLVLEVKTTRLARPAMTAHSRQMAVQSSLAPTQPLSGKTLLVWERRSDSILCATSAPGQVHAVDTESAMEARKAQADVPAPKMLRIRIATLARGVRKRHGRHRPMYLHQRCYG